MNFLPVAKLATQLVAGFGVSKIVAGIVQNNVPMLTTLDTVVVKTGSFVLSSILMEQTTDHIERMATTAARIINKEDSEENTEV